MTPGEEPVEVSGTTYFVDNTIPLLISAPLDFCLQSGSPAKWASVDVGLTSDFLGMPVHTPPSIGAYEFIPH